MPSRRTTLRVVSLAVLTVGTGCTSSSGTGDDAATTTVTDGPEDDASRTVESEAGSTPSVRVVVVDGDREVELVSGDDFRSVGEIRTGRSGRYQLPATLTDPGVERFSEGLAAVDAFASPSDHELVTVLDGAVVFRGSLAPGLAAAIEDGEWSGEFVFTLGTEADAERLRRALGEATTA